jgi:hypothetical protein
MNKEGAGAVIPALPLSLVVHLSGVGLLSGEGWTLEGPIRLAVRR